MSADHDRYVFVARPACPGCGEWHPARLKTQRATADEGDGTGTRKKLCRSCGRRFVLVLTPPGDPLGAIIDLLPELTAGELAELAARLSPAGR